jgi:hypothetical protein
MVPEGAAIQSLQIAERAPRARCYKCGASDIHSLCHHCATPMCDAHSPDPFRDGSALLERLRRAYFQRVRTSVRDSAETSPRSAEYASLDLDGDQAAVYHCEDHDHTVKGDLGWAILASGSLVLAGLLVVFFALIAGLILLLGSAVAAGIVYRVKWRRSRDASADPPSFPVFPHVHVAKITECLKGQVDLTDDDGYVSKVQSLQGKITMEMTHSDWQDRLQLYRRKYRVAADAPVPFKAGWALLQGEAGLRFSRTRSGGPASRLRLSFSGDSTDHALFTAVPGQAEGTWKVSVPYSLDPGREPQTIPLWIVPSVAPASDRRVLEIDLHWRPLGQAKNPPRLESFSEIKVEVPTEWGYVEGYSPGDALMSSPETGGPTVIEWRQLKPARNGGQNLSRSARASRSQTLKIQFEKPIMIEPTGDAGGTVGSQISGQVRANFNRTLSGLTGIGFYLPGGGRDQQAKAKLRTEVQVDFDISLSALRYQHHRVVPDRKIDVDPDLPREGTVEYYSVVPDYQTVVELVDAISDDDFYVKSVTEHLPKVDSSQLNVVRRVWDISGRSYDGVFPIDFGINVRGDEVDQRNRGGYASRTLAEITVQGAYANPMMREKIEGKWDQLHGLVEDLLRNRAMRGDGNLGTGQHDAEDAGAQDFVHDSDDGYAAPDKAAGQGQVIDPESGGQQPGNGDDGANRAHEVAELWRKLGDAESELLREQDPVRYQHICDIIERTRKRLKDLGESP